MLLPLTNVHIAYRGNALLVYFINDKDADKNSLSVSSLLEFCMNTICGPPDASSSRCCFVPVPGYRSYDL